jgi:hypothetical protein
MVTEIEDVFLRHRHDSKPLPTKRLKMFLLRHHYDSTHVLVFALLRLESTDYQDSTLQQHHKVRFCM